MPALSDRQQLIVDLVGDIDPVTADTPATPGDGIFYSYCPQLWDRYADKALISERLRELYVVRDGCDLVLGVVAPEVNVSGHGSTLQLGQRAQTFLQRRRDAQAEIQRIETDPGQTGGPDGWSGRMTVAAISAIEPISPPYTFGPNANAQRYAGSPYWPGGPRRVPW